MYSALFCCYLAKLFSLPIYSYSKADQKCLQLMDLSKFETKANSRPQKHRCPKRFDSGGKTSSIHTLCIKLTFPNPVHIMLAFFTGESGLMGWKTSKTMPVRPMAKFNKPSTNIHVK